MSILVLSTGGTIGAVAHDKLKNPDRIQIMPADGSDCVRDCLRESFAALPVRYVQFEQRDSNHIDDTYRGKLVEEIANASEQSILVTHGTDTLLQTADYLWKCRASDAKLSDQRIILTGAMVPLANGPESDGFMNLAFALQSLASGELVPNVYVVLCDHIDTAERQGWAPRLYTYAPGRYEKYYDKDDSRFSRLRYIG